MDTLLEQMKLGLRRAAVKLTHVGEQTVAVRTVVIHTYYYLPSIEVFRPFQVGGISYQNDELIDILTFTVSPDECRRMIESASQFQGTAEETTGGFSLSFTAVIDSPEGIKGNQVLLSQGRGVALHRALKATLDASNGVGAAVLEMQRLAGYAEI